MSHPSSYKSTLLSCHSTLSILHLVSGLPSFYGELSLSKIFFSERTLQYSQRVLEQLPIMYTNFHWSVKDDVHDNHPEIDEDSIAEGREGELPWLMTDEESCVMPISALPV